VFGFVVPPAERCGTLMLVFVAYVVAVELSKHVAIPASR
jgi:hypothetical protein